MGIDGEEKDEWGITDAQAGFSWDVNVEPQVLGRVSTYCYNSSTAFRRPPKSAGRMTPTT